MEATEVRDLTNQVADLFDEYHDLSPDEFISDGDSFRWEIETFMEHLAAADGNINRAEVKFISRATANTTYANVIRDSVDRSPLFDGNILSLVMDTAVEIDAMKAANGLDTESSLAQLVVQVYELAGVALLESDDNVSYDEVEFFERSMNRLVDFANSLDSCVHKVHRINALDGVSDTPSVGHKNAPNVKETTNASVEPEPTENIEELLQQLEELTGLKQVKQDVTALVRLQKVNKVRVSRGLEAIPISNHLVFYGNPGTGKTTVARLIAKIYHAMGLLSKGQLIEVDRSALVAGYVGQTAIKTQEVIDRSLGGILFIDEAYTLTSSGSDNDYGQEAVDTLLKAMEDHRDDFIVIVAGYPNEMKNFVESNPGLRSRFNKYINFEDYNVRELSAIFVSMCQKAGYQLTRQALEIAMQSFQKMYDRHEKNFANAREVRNFFEKAVLQQASRLFEIANPTTEQLTSMESSDVTGIV